MAQHICQLDTCAAKHAVRKIAGVINMFMLHYPTCQMRRLLCSLASGKSHSAFWQQLDPPVYQLAGTAEACVYDLG